MFFRLRDTRQPTPGSGSIAFLGAPGKPAFLPMGNGVLVQQPLKTYQPGTYIPNNAGISRMIVSGVIVGGAVMQPLSSSDGIGFAGQGPSVRGGGFYGS